MSPADTQTLRDQLAALPGVEHVVVDEGTGDVWLVLCPSTDPDAAVQNAAAVAHGRSVSVVFRPGQRDRQRVRFLHLNRTVGADQQITCEVRLEWAGREYSGAATGAKGDALELRTAASAALLAVLHLLPSGLGIRLAGVKQVRAFDADMVVVSLYRPGREPHNLVGAVIAGTDPPRAAAMAVLSALNRLLGNYLSLG